MAIITPDRCLIKHLQQHYRDFVSQIRQHHNEEGNLFQPGLIREMIVAEKLGHNVNTIKREHDAQSQYLNQSGTHDKYEYLTAYGGGSFQIDRVRSSLNFRAQQLDRITRNNAIFCASFDKDTLNIISIYQIDPTTLANDAERQLDNANLGGKQITHLSFPRTWVVNNGTLIP